jgi:hypothetical protein
MADKSSSLFCLFPKRRSQSTLEDGKTGEIGIAGICFADKQVLARIRIGCDAMRCDKTRSKGAWTRQIRWLSGIVEVGRDCLLPSWLWWKQSSSNQ